MTSLIKHSQRTLQRQSEIFQVDGPSGVSPSPRVLLLWRHIG